jgi:lipoyl-dependent peroxiredoxin
MATRNGSAEWKGGLKDGSGTITVGNGVHTGPYSFHSRFEDGEGTNPEELIAAAQAGCYSMQLSGVLGNDGHDPESVTTEARCELRNIDGKPTIAKIEMRTRAKVPGIDEDAFQQAVATAKELCLVTRALAGVGEITVEATLV